MNNNNNSSASKNLTKRIRSSLVLRLNAQMIRRLFAGFLSVNTLLVLMGIFVIIFNTESNMKDIIHMKELSEQSSSSSLNYIGNYSISSDVEKLKGFNFPEVLHKSFPILGERTIGITTSELTDTLSKKAESLKYSLVTQINNKTYQITYGLGQDLKLLLSLIFILLIFELIIIITETVKGSKMIRRTLLPLYELAEAAENLNKEVAALGTIPDERYINDLAGVINTIDANKLDKRIKVDSSQDELKSLAFAINDMLNRINDSYQSQVQFVSDASHELRTPISVIQGYVNLLDRWGKNDEKTMQESIDAIKSETYNMKDLVEQLLFLARGDNETIQLQLEEFDACDIVDEIVREAQMIDLSHTFNLDLDKSAFISADKSLIKQAIRILVDNSIKYTPEGEAISLRVSKDSDSVRITVQDSGIGIDSESLPRIFNRFYRSDDSRARKTGGSGLGLAIAKWIIERHGAYFEVLSRLNIGTRVTIVMPMIIKSDQIENIP